MKETQGLDQNFKGEQRAIHTHHKLFFLFLDLLPIKQKQLAVPHPVKRVTNIYGGQPNSTKQLAVPHPIKRVTNIYGGQPNSTKRMINKVQFVCIH